MAKGEAIREAMAKTIITFTLAAAERGSTGEETWQNLQTAVMKTAGVSKSVASCIIRDAWEAETKSKEPRR